MECNSFDHTSAAPKGGAALWDRIEQIVIEAGLMLFDLYVPTGSRGTLKVFIWRGPKVESDAPTQDCGVRGVNVDDCAKVSRKIIDLQDVDTLMPGDWLLEVSSPGINRRLRRPEHFATAVGERIFVRYAGKDKRTVQVTGLLLGFDGTVLELESGKKGEKIAIPLADVRSASVDFSYGV